MQQTNGLKRKYGVTFIIMLSCIFIFTLGQFIPIYFIDLNFRQRFYLFVLGVLFITTSLATFPFAYGPNKNKVLAGFTSIFIGIVTCVLFGFWYIILSMTIWTEAATYYISKDNPKIKIISRYLNEGAFGGGTEQSDYETVLQRPVFNLLKVQTKIDTNAIDKHKWIKSEW